MTDPMKTSPSGDGAHRESKRVESQVTLSAIGDVSVAATEAVTRLAAAPHKTRWLPLFAFFFVAYVAGCAVAIYTFKSDPWVQVFVAPLVLALMAGLAFWRRQVWKFRTLDWRFKERVQVDALNSLSHATANGLNAIRANLAGISEADSPATAAEHRKQVEQALERIDASLEKAIGQPPATPRPGPNTPSKASKSKAA